MQQVFGIENHYIQDEGRGHKILFVPFGLKILVRTLTITCDKLINTGGCEGSRG